MRFSLRIQSGLRHAFVRFTGPASDVGEGRAKKRLKAVTPVRLGTRSTTSIGLKGRYLVKRPSSCIHVAVGIAPCVAAAHGWPIEGGTASPQHVVKVRESGSNGGLFRSVKGEPDPIRDRSCSEELGREKEVLYTFTSLSERRTRRPSAVCGSRSSTMSEGEVAELCSGIEAMTKTKTTAKTEEEEASKRTALVGDVKSLTAEETMIEGRKRWPQPPKITLKTLSEDPAIGIVEVRPCRHSLRRRCQLCSPQLLK